MKTSFIPNAVLVVAIQAAMTKDLASRLPWLEGKVQQAGHATAYVCEHGTCQLPTTQPSVLRTQLSAKPRTRR